MAVIIDMNKPNQKQHCPLHGHGHRCDAETSRLTPYEYWLREAERENRKHRTQFGERRNRRRS
jgi:hypothetical protein